ncbi:unnamed protein product [Phytophthora fragariaefolia]|uniref:Unnamed protein product n=1 Tax=Phytophthora fragariaefolia TaxID=1490495 RepID=A0A9W6Y390_9STRA|nr:unnamed protein product [Phytophthora fragariaefolia]
MNLGPTRAALLQYRAKHATRSTPDNSRTTRETVMAPDRHSPEKPESFFQAAMERFLKEQQAPQSSPKPRSTGGHDVEMESVGSPDQPTTIWDPDDLDLGRPARATVATTTATTVFKRQTPHESGCQPCQN